MTARLERTTYGLGGSTVALHREGQLTPGGPYIEEPYYMHGNHLGSMTLLTDEAGAVVDQARYYPFGGYRMEPTEGITDIGFTGHRQDNLGWENTGLIYMGARYYDPLLRRFISADTIVPEPEETMAYNRFAYVNQNPVNLVDPTGRCAVDGAGHIKVDGRGYLSKTDCTVRDFQALSWAQRLEWLRIFVQQYELGDWFNDIMDAIMSLSTTPGLSDMDGWAAFVDAAVLQAINDGMRLVKGKDAIGNSAFGLVNGARGWRDFFRAWQEFVSQKDSGLPMWTENEVIALRLSAEQQGVDYAISLPESIRRYQDEDVRVQIQIDIFLWGADTYRWAGEGCRRSPGVCSTLFDAWTDPRQATDTWLFREVLIPAPGPLSIFLWSQMPPRYPY